MKDWTGGSASAHICNGNSNHTDEIREENDYYATDPIAIDLLCEREQFTPLVWEPACGGGHMARALEKRGYKVQATDKIYRGYGRGDVDFFELMNNGAQCTIDIITNPPYKYALQFVKHALDIVCEGRKVAMFLKLTFLEGQERKQFFEQYPPKTVYVSSKRIQCAKNGDFERYKKDGTAIAYAWYVWEKGYKGKPVIEWI
jgi:hypothetical protein